MRAHILPAFQLSATSNTVLLLGSITHPVFWEGIVEVSECIPGQIVSLHALTTVMVRPTVGLTKREREAKNKVRKVSMVSIGEPCFAFGFASVLKAVLYLREKASAYTRYNRYYFLARCHAQVLIV